jgi:hypothetical protein
VTSVIDEGSQLTREGLCLLYNRKWIEKGIYGKFAYFIHQDSVFWRSWLWKESGNFDESLKMAGDYQLWMKFAKHTALWSVKANVSCFRTRPNQLSTGVDLYREEQRRIGTPTGLTPQRVRAFFWLQTKAGLRCRGFFRYFYGILFPGRNKTYIDFDQEGHPVLRRAFSYIA